MTSQLPQRGGGLTARPPSWAMPLIGQNIFHIFQVWNKPHSVHPILSNINGEKINHR